MKFNPYKIEFNHPLWLDKQDLIFNRDGNKCIICGYPFEDRRRFRFWNKKQRKLVIHFRQYIFDMKRNRYIEPWKYSDNLLITLDTWCQEKGSQLFNIPIKKINS